MNKKLSKAFVLLLSFLMVFTMSVTAFAENGEGEKTPEEIQAEKQIAGNGQTQSFENGAVTMSKTIEATGTENLFDITLNVTTTEQINEIVSSPDAAVVLVIDASTSMDENRLKAARDAAKSFVSSFATASRGIGDVQRKIGIVTFGKNVITSSNSMLDIKSTTNEENLKNNIDGITKTESGTNIQAGLTKAKELLNGSGVTEQNCYVLLLSDGKPNAHYDSNGNFIEPEGDTTRHDDHYSVYNDSTSVKSGIAAEIRNSGMNIYSVFLGNTKTVLDCCKRTTVVDWLKQFSNAVYTTGNANDLTNLFNKISQIITVYANAWRVTDPMGTNIGFLDFIGEHPSANHSNGQLTWDLKADTSAVETNGTTSYTLKYQIKLDTLSNSFVAETDYDTNGKTTLDYFMSEDKDDENPELKTEDFEVPSVKGYSGSFSFKKVDENGNPLEGAKFRLTTEDNEDWYMEVTSSEDGIVEFENVPSGHEYILSEYSAPEGYIKSEEEKTISVAYGVVEGEDITESDFQWVNTPANTEPETFPVSFTKKILVAEGSEQPDMTNGLTFKFTLTGNGIEAQTATAIFKGTAQIGDIENVRFGNEVPAGNYKLICNDLCQV